MQFWVFGYCNLMLFDICEGRIGSYVDIDNDYL